MEFTPPTRLIKPAVVQDRTTLDRVTIWRKVKAGTFPKPVQISEGRIAWREQEIESWISACGAGPAAVSGQVGA